MSLPALLVVFLSVDGWAGSSLKPGSHKPFLFDKFSLTSFIYPCEQGKLPFFHLSSLLV